ncbi:MAG: efflux RND transporter periplasmic adaptor subunit [Vicinamibacterales bacterium]
MVDSTRPLAPPLCVAALVLTTALAVTACSGGGAGPVATEGRAGGAPAAAGRGRGGGGPVAVKTARVVVKPMAVNVRVVGNVEAASTVNVRAQVTGELKTVEFSEGQDVAKGQLLFTLDPRPFELAVRQAETAFARDAAQSRTAEAQAERSTELLAKGLVAPSAHETTQAQAAAIRGAMASDQVQIDNAKLQLQFTRITASVSGRTGALLVHEGSLIRNNDTTPLVVINQISPVFVSFAVPARLLAQLQHERGKLHVEASPAGGAERGAEGTVSFLDNSVDRATDTIRLKATFPNRDRRLWPGAFVDVTLRLAETPQALVIPNAAVQASQQGQLVYVVKSDRTVEARPITVGWTEGDETVVARGLSADETVVTDGQLRLTPGARVTTGQADGRGGRGTDAAGGGRQSAPEGAGGADGAREGGAGRGARGAEAGRGQGAEPRAPQGGRP